MTAPALERPSVRRIEYHMGTAVTLAASGIDTETGDRFFDSIERHEDLLSRFRSHSQLSQIASASLALDQADPAVREVLTRCEQLRDLTHGAFEFEPWHPSRRADAPRLDPNALAKGWIIDQAALELRLAGADEYWVNAGGDIVVFRPSDRAPWRVGIQHPLAKDSVFGTIVLTSGAVATSGTYERKNHIWSSTGTPGLTSTTVVGPDLAVADALATAVFAASDHRPSWWSDVDQSYGLLTLDTANTLRWTPPRDAMPGHSTARFESASARLPSGNSGKTDRSNS